MSASDTAVSIRNLSKAYTIAHDQEKHVTLAETILSRLKNPLRRPSTETFWALNDVSFDIKKGEVVGIIGRNGAGKSTLLKVLSRITEPTKGVIELFGRVGSLLEVGTGFHPELTGRENVFLNGAILGMSKPEIRSQFDAIVDFAGVEKFLDTPVKRYSSGMYVRLAFAVAAHLNSEILIIDEVLAVGDAEFQKKCLGKMGEVARGGRTILFVSHNMAAIENLCTQVMFMEKGGLTASGDCAEVIHRYLNSVQPAVLNSNTLAMRTDRSGNGQVKLTSFHVENENGTHLRSVSSGMDIQFVLGFTCPKGAPSEPVDVGVSIHTQHDQLLFVLYSSYTGRQFTRLPASGEFRCRIPHFPLSTGSYTVGVRVIVGIEESDWPRDGVGSIDVEAGDFWRSGSAGFGGGAPLLMQGDWVMDDPQAMPSVWSRSEPGAK
jgi:lipopolysaccharide transport system ATP-binding protein